MLLARRLTSRGSSLACVQKRTCAPVLQRWCSSSTTSGEGYSALRAQLLALPKEEREGLVQEVLEQSEAEEATDKPPTISTAQMTKLFVATAIPMVGFGFVDNAVMIASGEFLEIKLGAALAISTLAAAGLGNMVSDVVGLGAGGIIEAGAAKLGCDAPALTAAQLAGRGALVARHSGSIIGISVGCLLGMFPLLFHDQEDIRHRCIFKRYDKDGNGTLDRDELLHAFHDAKTYPSGGDMDNLFEKYDTDKDGTIGYPEFRAMLDDLESRMKQDSELEARSLMAGAAASLGTRSDDKPQRTDKAT